MYSYEQDMAMPDIQGEHFTINTTLYFMYLICIKKERHCETYAPLR
jgi:hypothetical protein